MTAFGSPAVQRSEREQRLFEVKRVIVYRVCGGCRWAVRCSRPGTSTQEKRGGEGPGKGILGAEGILTPWMRRAKSTTGWVA